jgi:hypothetical protein
MAALPKATDYVCVFMQMQIANIKLFALITVKNLLPLLS